MVETEEPQIEELANRYDELVDGLDQQFGKQVAQQRGPPMVTPPRKPTQDEREKHQLTRAPYEPWCTHCVASLVVRRRRPRRGRKHQFVPDHDGSAQGPVILFMGYMYLHERTTGDEQRYNPFHLVAIGVPKWQSMGIPSTTHRSIRRGRVVAEEDCTRFDEQWNARFYMACKSSSGIIHCGMAGRSASRMLKPHYPNQ